MSPGPIRRPPPTRAVDQVDTLHGVEVADPYRWLENTESPETAAWIAAQNEVTFAYLESLPLREELKQRLTALYDYERYSIPYHRGGRYFYTRNTGLQNQAILYLQDSLAADGRELLDPNGLSPDGTVALSLVEPSPDGRLLLYGTSASGSDWQEFRIRQVDDGIDRADHLRWIKFSRGSWTRDGKGFFYSRYPEPVPDAALSAQNRDMKVYYHRLGTDQREDQLVYERPDQPDWGFAGEVTHDGRYLVLTVWLGTDSRTRVYYHDLGDPLAPNPVGPVVKLLDDFDAAYGFIGNAGPIFYFRTDRDAARGRVIAIDTRAPAPDAWREIISEAEQPLDAVALVGGRLVTSYLVDAKSRLAVVDLDGNPVSEIPLPGIGTAGGISGEPDRQEMFFAFTSSLVPTSILRYDLQAGALTPFRAPKLTFDPSVFVTEQVFVTSRDGTQVPVFLTHRKELVRDGSHPTLLYGYGGFNANLTPFFDPATIAWLEQGGIYAQANLRGGGEYGEDWHRAGMFEKKQNVFDDCTAVAEYLIREGYTGAGHLAVEGASNGGLLVGAVMTQRPELFAVALPDVGVMDMLRYHHFTIGWAWATEYGRADDAAHFHVLRAYSPLHNLKPGTNYPATLVTTADHDDRVVPGHSFKFAAALQASTTWDRPAYIRIETKAGHGAGKPVSKLVEARADVLAFALANTRSK